MEQPRNTEVEATRHKGQGIFRRSISEEHLRSRSFYGVKGLVWNQGNHRFESKIITWLSNVFCVPVHIWIYGMIVNNLRSYGHANWVELHRKWSWKHDMHGVSFPEFDLKTTWIYLGYWNGKYNAMANSMICVGKDQIINQTSWQNLSIINLI